MKKEGLLFLLIVGLLCAVNVSSSDCSWDTDCTKCGNTCILTKDWTSSCPPPVANLSCKCADGTCVPDIQVVTEEENQAEKNETVTSEENQTEENQIEENQTEEQQEKTKLSDCSTICLSKVGCVCPQNCEKNETIQGSSCGKKETAKPTPTIKEISLCEGCSTNDDNNPCIEIGTQKQETDGTIFYCSVNKKMETAKAAGENCDNDYECLTYTCSEGVCFEEQKEEETGMNSSQILIILAAIIIIGGLILFTFKFLHAKKTVVKEEKKVEKKRFEIQEPEQKYSYKYRPEFDVLEKQLKESLKNKK